MSISLVNTNTVTIYATNNALTTIANASYEHVAN